MYVPSGLPGDINFGGAKAVQITSGQNHSCALLETGGVRCWGLGINGQLGYGSNADIGDNEHPLNDVPIEPP